VNHATTAVKERPVIFTAHSVRQILSGVKTQTRRICKKAMGAVSGDDPAASVHPDGAGVGWVAWWPDPVTAEETARLYPGEEGFRCPHGSVGERLWVKEAWGLPWHHAQPRYFYRAHFKSVDVGEHPDFDGWRSSMYMPRHASRLTLEITGVRVERLWQITEADLLAEGIKPLTLEPKRTFIDLWDRINGKRPGCAWRNNPWVWVIEFRRADA
jgi:hypothetical protein